MLVIKSQNVETTFLPEAELPGFARLNYDHSPEPRSPQAPTTSQPTSLNLT